MVIIFSMVARPETHDRLKRICFFVFIRHINITLEILMLVACNCYMSLSQIGGMNFWIR